MSRKHPLIVSAAALVLPCLFGGRALQAQDASSPSATVAAIPRLIRVSGSFAPATGLPPSPVETVTLAIYAEETGGTPRWQETQNVALDKSGRFTVLLGATRPEGIPPDVFASGEAQWLGMQFAGVGEVEGPRSRIASVPYALRTSDADMLGGRPASAYLRADTPDVRTAGTASDASSVDPETVLVGSPNVLSKYVTASDIGPSAVYETGGLVGIGTMAPADALHVRFTNTFGGMTGLAVQNLGNTAASYSGMLFYDQNGVLGQFQGFNNATHEYRINNIAPGGTINLMLGSSSKFLVDQNGDVGIGYVPQSFCRLCVEGSRTNAAYVRNNSAGGIGVNAGAASSMGGTGVSGWAVSGWGVAGESNIGGIGVRARADSGIGLFSSSVTGTALTANSTSGPVIATFFGPGSVGIGRSPLEYLSVSCKLCIAGESTNTVGVLVDALSGTGIRSTSITGTGLDAYSYSGVALSAESFGGAAIATFTGPGRVGIGTSSPADKLHVTGDIRIGTEATGCIKDADATVIAGTCSSDARLKKNITPFASALASLTQLQPVYFDWRGDEFPDRHLGPARSFGLIAQEVETILPELVTTDPEGYKAVKYGQLPFYMLQAIKDLKVENDALKERLNLLQVQFSERLRRLEQRIGK